MCCSKKGAPQSRKRTPEEAAALAAFDEITEAASALMDAGELDVYSAAREEFERASAAFPAPDEDDDMFGDDSGADGEVCTHAQSCGRRHHPAGQHRPEPCRMSCVLLQGWSVGLCQAHVAQQAHRPSHGRKFCAQEKESVP